MIAEHQRPRFEIPKERHSGLHFLSADQQAEFNDLFETNQIGALKKVKEWWQQSADHEFLSNFTLVHWVSIDNLQAILRNPDVNKEISTKPYLNPPFTNGFAGYSIGLVIKGKVTLAGNADLQTNQWHTVSKDGKKYTEWLNRLFTTAENCLNPYECVVDNWSVEAIVITNPDEATLPLLIQLAQTLDLKILDENGEQIQF